MILTREKTSTNFKTLSVAFDDNILSLNQQSLVYEQGLSLNYVDVLSSVVDNKISNHSNLFISNKSLESDFLKYAILPQKIKTTPIFIAVNAFPTITTNSKYLTFDTTNTLPVTGNYHRSLSFRSLSSVGDFTQCILELELLNNDYCRLKHIFNNTNYYLKYDPASLPTYLTNFYFSTGYTISEFTTLSSINQPDVFQYRLDEVNNLAILKKYIASELHTICGYRSGIAALTAIKTLSAGPFDNTSIFYANYPILTPNPKINTSWISYTTPNINQSKINNAKSVFNLPDNKLLHSEYNNISDTINLKILKLKNNFSDKNYSKRSSYLHTITSVNQGLTPYPDFREYTSISTGVGGECGNDDITLNYVFYNQDYSIFNGKPTTIQTPETLFPYTQLNINDTTFVRDGAFGCKTPAISDRIYRVNDTSNTTKYGTYLITWLSASNIGDYGVWMDRYYYPDLISRKAAMSGSSSFTPSFNNPLQTLIDNSLSNISLVNQTPMFDKVSDLVIQPSSLYVYERTTTNTVQNYVNTFNGLVHTDFSQVYDVNGNTITYNEKTITFNNDKYVVYTTDDINKTGNMVLKFDLLNNWYTTSFNTLFGTMVDRGFSITNDEKVTPFTYVYGSKVLTVYNSEQTVIYTLSFPSNIKDVIVGNHLADFYITYDNALVRVSSSGQIKNICTNPQLSSYINYDLKNSSNLTFLLQSNGSCINVDLNSFNFTPLTATTFTTNASTSAINGIKYINNVCYGFLGNKVLKTNGDYIFHLVNNKDIYREQISTRSRTPTTLFCTTSSIIYDVDVDSNGNLNILHNAGKTVTQVDQYKNIVNTYTLPNSGNFLIDFVSEYTLSGFKFEPITLSTNTSTNLLEISRLTTDFTLKNKITTSLSGAFLSANQYNLSSIRIKHLTNYNYFIDNKSADYLNFNLILKNYYTDNDLYSQVISIPIEKLKGGIQNFIVCVDQNLGSYSLYTNGILLSSISFDSNKYRFNSVFKTHFLLGATGFHNEQTLGEFCLQPKNYFIDNVTVANLKIYNESLLGHQLQALALEDIPVDNLSISLPCGQRNNIEEINKIFKFTQPYNKSNNVNIVVKNLGSVTSDVKTGVVNNLLVNLDNILPTHVNINDIRFENYR